MFSPQQERYKKMAEAAPVVRIFAVLFISVALLEIVNLENIFPIIFIQIMILLVVLYFSTFGLEIFRGKIADIPYFRPILFDLITLFASFIFLAFVLLATGGNESNFKILLLPTTLFYTLRFGKRWGQVASGLAALILTGMNVYAGFDEQALTLETDLIYVGVFFLTSWLVGTMVDLERSISDRLSREVTVDYLTGLFNHRHLQEELNRRIKMFPDQPFGLIMADLDYFRHYNETKSHEAGDRLLIDVAGNISKTVGDEGTVFRFGSDEFAVMMDSSDRNSTLEMAEKIRCRIKENYVDASADDFWKFNLTASFGVAMFPEDASTREELLNKTDEALYKAKVISGNKVEAYFSILEQVESQVDSSEKEIFDRLKTFLLIINARDRYTYGHSERVLIYAGIIASLVDLDPIQTKALQYGAYLHDIGKIDIDRAVLNKPYSLTEEEWASIKKHPVWGAEIIKQVKVLDPAVPAVLYHHERYDGNGYPFNLAGEEIPLVARIMNLADSFDAMTVERVYKPPKSYQEAIVELELHRGTQFDPNLTDRFVEFLKKHNSVREILTLETRERFLS